LNLGENQTESSAACLPLPGQREYPHAEERPVGHPASCRELSLHDEESACKRFTCQAEHAARLLKRTAPQKAAIARRHLAACRIEMRQLEQRDSSGRQRSDIQAQQRQWSAPPGLAAPGDAIGGSTRLFRINSEEEASERESVRELELIVSDLRFDVAVLKSHSDERISKLETERLHTQAEILELHKGLEEMFETTQFQMTKAREHMSSIEELVGASSGIFEQRLRDLAAAICRCPILSAIVDEVSVTAETKTDDATVTEDGNDDNPKIEDENGDEPNIMEEIGDVPKVVEESGDEPKGEEETSYKPKLEEEKGDESKAEENGDGPKIEEDNGNKPKIEEENGDEPKIEEDNGDEPKIEEENGDGPKIEEENGDEPKVEEENDDKPEIEEENGGDPKSLTAATVVHGGAKSCTDVMLRRRQRVDDERLDELVRDFRDNGKRPTAKLEPWVGEAVARRLQTNDDDKAAEWYQQALREKPRSWKTWWDITDLIDMHCVAAVTGYGACEAAGTARHKKKCSAIGKALAKLEPSAEGDLNAIDKHLKAAGKLIPWNGELMEVMEATKDDLLSAQ